MMKRLRGAALLLLSFLLFSTALRARATAFVVKPFLQLGTDAQAGTLTLVWLAPDEGGTWSVEVTGGKTSPVSSRRLVLAGRTYRQCDAQVHAQGRFDYRVLRDGRALFRASAVAPPGAGASYHAALVGDVGFNNGSERAIASAIQRDGPGLVLLAGDLAYREGTHGQVVDSLYPVYNADRNLPGVGVSLMRAVPFVAAPGNHDVPVDASMTVRFDALPDALAYFYDWMQPLNGPWVSGPRLDGPVETVKGFRESAQHRFPRMGSFSFDWGCSHWTVLDSNPYVDWRDPALRRWVAADLERARGAAWRFVMFHHPPFHSTRAHQGDQWMRVLADVFERGHVSVVFSGHVHNYQRSRPFFFKAAGGPGRAVEGGVPSRAVEGGVPGRAVEDGVPRKRRVDGAFQIDRAFDGVRVTRPQGVIYVVSGAGGAPLHGVEGQSNPREWHPFTVRMVADTWSFTDLRVDPRSVTIRQLGADDRELDRFTITP